MAQIRVTPDNRINVAETIGEISAKLQEIFDKSVGGFIGLTQISTAESCGEERTGRDIKEKILVNIDHIISID